MDQTRIGTFIAVLRKEKGLTQKELAEQIGISDKTVSKWETGNGMPDIAYLSPLCEVLDINVNELLSGEKLPSEEYLGKAEENMKHLMQENQNNKNAGRWQGLVGIALLAVAVFLTFGLSQAKIGWYVDCPSIILIVCICAACVLFSGCRTKYEVVHFLRKTVLPRSGGYGHHGSGITSFSFRSSCYRTEYCCDGTHAFVCGGGISCTLRCRDTYGAQEEAELARRLCGYGKRAPGGSPFHRQYKTARTELAGICY